MRIIAQSQQLVRAPYVRLDPIWELTFVPDPQLLVLANLALAAALAVGVRVTVKHMRAQLALYRIPDTAERLVQFVREVVLEWRAKMAELAPFLLILLVPLLVMLALPAMLLLFIVYILALAIMFYASLAALCLALAGSGAGSRKGRIGVLAWSAAKLLCIGFVFSAPVAVAITFDRTSFLLLCVAGTLLFGLVALTIRWLLDMWRVSRSGDRVELAASAHLPAGVMLCFAVATLGMLALWAAIQSGVTR